MNTFVCATIAQWLWIPSSIWTRAQRFFPGLPGPTIKGHNEKVMEECWSFLKAPPRVRDVLVRVAVEVILRASLACSTSFRSSHDMWENQCHEVQGCVNYGPQVISNFAILQVQNGSESHAIPGTYKSCAKLNGSFSLVHNCWLLNRSDLQYSSSCVHEWLEPEVETDLQIRCSILLVKFGCKAWAEVSRRTR